MNMGKLEKTITSIEKILKKDTRGLTIQDLANHTKVSRITASLALANLIGASKLDVRKIGKYRLHYWRFK
jgi:response regulator of citrate/malate metabolism